MKFIRNHPWWSSIIAGIVLLFAVAGITGEEEENGGEDSRGDVGRQVQESEPEPEPEPRPEPEPDGRYSVNCDYLLGDFSEGPEGYRFVGGGELENTGNIGIVVRARFEWELLGTGPVEATEERRIDIGKTRDVQITIPAMQTQIDAHQSADADCDASVKIIDTFGKPR